MSGARLLRQRAVVVWVVLAVLVGAIAVIERVGARADRAVAADPNLLLPVPLDQLGAIEVAHAGRSHRFERDAAGAWFYHGAHTGAEAGHAHPADPAQSARIGAALAALGRAKVERRLPREGNARAFGLAAPQTVILLYRPKAAQPAAQLAVGDVAADTVSRYVEPVGSPEVVTIPAYQIDNLLALIQAVEPTASR